MYVGNYSMVLGFILIYGSAWGYALMAPFFAFIYLAITTAEEVYLRDKFGAAYDDYARRVNRFIPNPRGLRASLAEFSYDWRRALVKEYGTICFALVSLVDPAGVEDRLGLRLRGAQVHDSMAVRRVRAGADLVWDRSLPENNEAAASGAQGGDGRSNCRWLRVRTQQEANS